MNDYAATRGGRRRIMDMGRASWKVSCLGFYNAKCNDSVMPDLHKVWGLDWAVNGYIGQEISSFLLFFNNRGLMTGEIVCIQVWANFKDNGAG